MDTEVCCIFILYKLKMFLLQSSTGVGMRGV